MERSLKDRIERWVKSQNRPVSGGTIERIVSENTNYKPSNASRRCRELVDEGKFKAIHKDGTVYYQWNDAQVSWDREMAIFDAL